MKTIKLISIAIIATLIASSCEWMGSQTVIGSGDVESMEVRVAKFSGVSVTGTCDVDIQIGETQEVWFSAQPQILDVLTYEVRNDILEIGFKSNVNVKPGRDIRAEIVLPALSYVAVTGAGNYTLSGSEQADLDINITGTGKVNAYDMKVDHCTVIISGAGSCEVNVDKNLDVYISGVGDVFYRGTPLVTTDVSGVGNVVDSNL